MKRCPTCRRVYYDETLNFCRIDGTPLAVTSDESQTELIQSSQPPNETLQTRVQPAESIQPSAVITDRPRPSVAVLPFTPLGAGSGDEYLGLGMADSLITRLSGINRITVRPTSAIRKYTDVGRNSVEAGREQRVDAVLEGSIQRAGERIRVTARLVNVPDGASLWGYSGDEQCTDIFAVEDSITEKIVASLVKNLSRNEERQSNKHYTQSAEAFHLYLKGRYHWNRFTQRELEKAIEYYNQAVRKDPTYALAYSGLADCYSVLGLNYQSPADSFPKAREAATRALQIDEMLSEAHTSLGAVKLFYEWNWEEAERELKRGLDLNSTCASYQLYAYYHHVIGRPDVAITLLELALEVDPLSPIVNSDLGWAHVFARQYDKAMDQGFKTLEIDPNFAMAHLVIGMAYEHKGLHKKAIKALGKAAKLSNDGPRILAWLGYGYATAGSTVKAQQVLEKLMSGSKERHIDPYNIALLHIGLGEDEKALDSLEQAYEERSGQLIFLRLDPSVDNLRSNPRFIDLLERLGL